MTDKFIFIGGVGRSGTSITREIFSTHNDVIAFSFEYRFMIDPDGIVNFIKSCANNWTPFYYDKMLKRLESFLYRLGKKNKLCNIVGRVIRSNSFLKKHINADAYHGWALEEYFPNYSAHVAALIEELQDFSFRGSWVGADSFKVNHSIYYANHKTESELIEIFSSFLKKLFADLFKKEQKNTIVDDNTWNLLYSNELFKLFETSKFIHVKRDPRDVVSSFCKQRWMPTNKRESAIICRDLYSQINLNLSKLPEDKVLVISLEELIAEKARVIGLLEEFTGVAYSENMYSFPLSSSSVGRWQIDFDESEKKALEPILKNITEELGYEW